MNHDEVEQVHRDDLAQAVRAVKKPDAKLSTIDKIRKIVADRQFNRVGGLLVDGLTASVVVQVHDSFKVEANREKFAKLPVRRMVATAWAIVNKSGGLRST